MSDLELICRKIMNDLSPVSISLYGSRSRLDHTNLSDYEVGVLKSSLAEYGRSVFSKYSTDSIKIYPFIFEDILEGNIQTPFQQRFFLYDIASNGKTLAGRTVETLNKPTIKISDALSEVSFNLAYSISSLQAFRKKVILWQLSFFQISFIWF